MSGNTINSNWILREIWTTQTVMNIKFQVNHRSYQSNNTIWSKPKSLYICLCGINEVLICFSQESHFIFPKHFRYYGSLHVDEDDDPDRPQHCGSIKGSRDGCPKCCEHHIHEVILITLPVWFKLVGVLEHTVDLGLYGFYSMGMCTNGAYCWNNNGIKGKPWRDSHTSLCGESIGAHSAYKSYATCIDWLSWDAA